MQDDNQDIREGAFWIIYNLQYIMGGITYNIYNSIY